MPELPRGPRWGDSKVVFMLGLLVLLVLLWWLLLLGLLWLLLLL